MKTEKMKCIYMKKHFYVHTFFVNKVAFIHFVNCYLHFLRWFMNEELRFFFHLCLSAKISVAKCFEFRHTQKLVPQNNFKFRPQSAKISSEKINAAVINSFRVVTISHSFGSLIIPFRSLNLMTKSSAKGKDTISILKINKNENEKYKCMTKHSLL